MGNMPNNYFNQETFLYNKKLDKIKEQLPDYVSGFFTARSFTTTAKTKYAYASDLHTFFNYLHENNPMLQKKSLKEISLDDLNQLTAKDLEEFQSDMAYYENKETGRVYINKRPSIARKLSTLRSFFSYLYREGDISQNITQLVDIPKIPKHNIVRLDPEEISDIFDYMESCHDKLSPQQQAFYEKTIIRDTAIITLLLGTGLRISECIGLDIDDVNFKDDSLAITRKGGKEAIVYFGDEVEEALGDYMDSRENIVANKGSEKALFLSLQKNRISADAIRDVVKKYTKPVTNKRITPHKFRSTFGTALYQSTNDIYLVADVLGHEDVNTTRDFYADLDNQRKKEARNVVKLRKKDETE